MPGEGATSVKAEPRTCCYHSLQAEGSGIWGSPWPADLETPVLVPDFIGLVKAGKSMTCKLD